MRFTLFGLFIMTSNLHGQDLKNPFLQDSITVTSDKCQKEINRADLDFEKNLFVIQLEKPVPFTDTQQKILFELYGVHSSFSTGLFAPNYDCYNFHLKTLAKSKWRHDIFRKSKLIADSLDKIGLGDRQVEFKNGSDELMALLRANISEKSRMKLKHDRLKTLFIKVYISEKGTAENVRIVNSINHGDVEIEILAVVKDKQLWTPKTDDGKAIKTWIIYPVELDDW